MGEAKDMDGAGRGGDHPIPAFMINLARDGERRAAMTAALTALGVPFERVGAVQGRRFAARIRASSGQRFYSPLKGRPLTDGEIGCSLSHIAALRRIVRRGLPRALILEDDVLFAEGFAAFWRGWLPGMLTRCDIIKIEGILYPHTSRTGPLIARAPQADLIVPLKPSLGSACYAVTLAGARGLLRALERVEDPFDLQLSLYDRHGVRFGELRPLLARQIDLADTALERERRAVGGDATPRPSSPGARGLIREATRRTRRVYLWARWAAAARLRGPSIAPETAP